MYMITKKKRMTRAKRLFAKFANSAVLEKDRKNG